MKALNQMRKLTNKVRPRLQQVKCPTMLIHTQPDLTSGMENFHIVKDSISSEKQSDLILEKATHNLFSDGVEQTLIFENILTFLNENSSIS